MPRSPTGSIMRSGSRLRVRVTTHDPFGKVYRPWIDLDASLSDEQAKDEAKRIAEAASVPGWAPPRPKTKFIRSFPTVADVLAHADLNDPRVVYFARCVTKAGPIKIGVTDNIARRFSQLQNACPYQLELIGTLSGGAALEGYFHRLFARYRTRGEWFELPPLAEKAIRRLTEDALWEAS